jgi:hypothetical protein
MRRTLLFSLVLIGLSAAIPARAADTTEGFGAGATDVELYLGIEGVGQKGSARRLSGDVLVGYGIVDALSIYIGANGSMLDDGKEGASEFYTGAFGTLLDTAHFDIDWTFELRMGGRGLSELSLIPGFEINLDAKQDMSSVGVYLRSALPLYGRELGSSDHPTRDHIFSGMHLEVVFGAYYTIASGHQLLLEHDIELRPRAGANERGYGLGGLALAYNIMIRSDVELVSQVYLDLPQSGEQITLAFMTGFILTVPGS